MDENDVVAGEEVDEELITSLPLPVRLLLLLLLAWSPRLLRC